MKKLYLLLCTLPSIATLAQVAADIEYNNVRARVHNNGLWFRNSNYEDDSFLEAAFEVPKGEGVSTLFSTGFWMGGLSANQTLHLAALRFAESQDYFIGPKSNNSTSEAFLNKYNHIWRVSQQEILDHQSQYMNPDYEMPWSIANWPGNGDVAHGEAAQLAPYVDANQDGVYTPLLGDYPEILGHEALYFMLNDCNQPHQKTDGQPIGADIHAMTYCFKSVPGSPLNDCVFVSLKIRNTGTQSLSDFYVGVYNDFDLGNWADDYVGSDSLRNMTYAYNGDNFDDQVSSSAGYGEYLPAQGCMFLNNTMAKSLYFNNNTGVNGDPTQTHHYYNYMRGIWKDNTLVTEGGDGYGGTTPANFMFSGDPVANTGWTEISSNNNPSDRRIIMSTGPFDFLPGDQLCIDLAFPFARSAQEYNAVDAITELRIAADFIQDFYDNQIFGCSSQTVGSDDLELLEISRISVYPNPSNGRFVISIGDEIKNLEIFDQVGKCIFSKKMGRNNAQSVEVDLTGSANGLYLFKAHKANGEVVNGKLIIE